MCNVAYVHLRLLRLTDSIIDLMQTAVLSHDENSKKREQHTHSTYVQAYLHNDRV